MSQREVPRRVTGIHWLITQDFVDRLLDLLKAKTAVDVAKEVGDAIGEEVDRSSISRLKGIEITEGDEPPSSILVGPICKLYGWPVPPMAKASEQFGLDVAGLYELEDDDPVGLAEIREAIHDRVRSLRKIRQLRRRTPGTPDS